MVRDDAVTDEITFTTRTVEEWGIELPWEQIEQYGPQVRADGAALFPDRPPRGTVLRSGTIFIPLRTLCRVAEQAPFDSEFGETCLVNRLEGYALVAAGLAVQELRGGVHGTHKLRKLLERRNLE